MRNTMVLAVDHARARFMYLEPAEVPELMSGPDLVESEVMYNPEERAQDTQLFSDRQCGRGNGHGSGGHGYDDHRHAHRKTIERRFFKDVADRCLALSGRRRAQRVLLVGDPRILSMLRSELRAKLDHSIEVDECPENLATLSPIKLHSRLASARRLPARQRPH